MTAEQQQRALTLLSVAKTSLTATNFDQRDWVAQQIQEFLWQIDDEENRSR